MAKIIQLTEKEFAVLREEFEQALKLIKVSDGKLSYTKQFGSFERKAELCFTAEAHEKMQALVREFDKEVAWHGVARRLDEDGKDGYIISDILVYPQTVTGASVEMDVDAYDKWIRDNAEDDRMYELYMQGHSHVNMAVFASSTDLKHQSDILNMIPKTGFYIFIIANKKGDMDVKIYDLKKNVLFEQKDIDVKVLPPETDVPEPIFEGVSEDEKKALTELLSKLRSEKRTKEFISWAKKMVQDKTYTYAGKSEPSLKPVTKTQETEKKPDKKADEAPKKRKGKRKKDTKPTSYYTYDDYDDEYHGAWWMYR